MRQVILDVETTGLSTSAGHRILEIAILEMIDHKLTDNKLVFRFNPDRDIPEEVTAIHGITAMDVADAPMFFDHANDIIEFIGTSTIIAHNAVFDMRFLNYELDRHLLSKLDNPVICTMNLAKSKIKGVKYNLNALCDHFGINREHRELHGALLDCELCAEVYVKLLK